MFLNEKKRVHSMRGLEFFRKANAIYSIIKWYNNYTIAKKVVKLTI